jgi:hypothetical protein
LPAAAKNNTTDAEVLVAVVPTVRQNCRRMTLRRRILRQLVNRCSKHLATVLTDAIAYIELQPLASFLVV